MKNPVLQWSFLVVALVVPTLCALFYFREASQGTVAQIAYSVTKLSMLVLPLLAYGMVERKLPGFGRGMGREHLGALPLGLASGLAIAGVILGAFYLTPLGEAARQAGPKIAQVVEEKGLTKYYVAFAAFLALGHSLLEEYYWRWYVFGQLRGFVPRPVAYAVASLGFAAHHYVVLWAFFSPGMAIFLGTMVGVGGAIWCALYERQTSLVGTWLSHCLVDVAALWVGYVLLF